MSLSKSRGSGNDSPVRALLSYVVPRLSFNSSLSAKSTDLLSDRIAENINDGIRMETALMGILGKRLTYRGSYVGSLTT